MNCLLETDRNCKQASKQGTFEFHGLKKVTVTPVSTVISTAHKFTGDKFRLLNSERRPLPVPPIFERLFFRSN